MIAVAYAGAALAVTALAMTGLNAVTWPRGRPGARFAGRVSALVPARDEADNIAACVDAIARSEPPVDEIVVYDDGSTDGTAAILAELAHREPRLRVLHGDGLPEGWVGKPHAAHRLALAATGDWLVFVDADVRLERDAIGRLASLAADLRGDVLTVMPRQVMGTVAEQALMPLLAVTYASWLPLFLVHTTQDRRLLAANGQVLAVRRAVYDAIGGFRAVRRSVVDDMALCRIAKDRGHTVVFADGTALARCRMYGSAGELWRGFSKNLFEGLGERTTGLFGVIGLYALSFVVPWLALAAGAVTGGPLLVAGLVGVGANVAQRALLAVRHGHPAWSIAAHPIAVVFLLAIAVNSWRWTRRGAVSWRGRTYASLREREAA